MADFQVGDVLETYSVYWDGRRVLDRRILLVSLGRHESYWIYRCKDGHEEFEEGTPTARRYSKGSPPEEGEFPPRPAFLSNYY